MARVSPDLPQSRGKPRVDDRCVLSGIIFVNGNGLCWRDAPRDCGPHKTLYICWKLWVAMSVFARIMGELSAQRADPQTIMMDANYLKAHRTASSLQVKRGSRIPDRRTKGGMNNKLHAVTDASGRPLSFFITAGHISDHTGAAPLLDDLPKAQ